MLRALLALYSWRYPLRLIELWRRNPNLGSYLGQYWRTTDFSRLQPEKDVTDREASSRRMLAIALYAWLLLQMLAGIMFLALWYSRDVLGGWQFGLALLLAIPLVLAYVLPLCIGVWWLVHPKALGRAVLCHMLEAQVGRLRKRNKFDVVAVVGSVGKTSTKMAIARTLSASRRVQWQEGNYNDRVTVPLIFFGHNEPSIFNIPAWIRILIKNEHIIRRPYPYQVVVAELGPDGPGQMQAFAYLRPELVVVTAVTPEHMEFFKTLDAVAEEELLALEFGDNALVNTDDVAASYLQGRLFQSYGLQPGATYSIEKRSSKGHVGQQITFRLGEKDTFEVHVSLLGEQGAKIALAAAASAHLLGVPVEDIRNGISQVTAFSGRMQILAGVQDSTLIDDTYNSTPIAAKAALDVLQAGNAPQRIAILGSMNELGDFSPAAHREVAEHCDPSKLDWVITIGKDAKEYLAPLAKERGCQVRTFLDPYKAGRFAKKQLKDGAVVLAKGSQNGVFAEEALKQLLADPDDASKLVRQSEAWMAVKAKQFKP